MKLSRGYMPFTYKMMIPYLLLVLLTDVLIGYVSYTMLVQSRTEMAETNIRTGMEQARNNIRYQMDEIQRMSDTLFGSLTFQAALQKRGEPLEIYWTMLDGIVPQITAPLELYGNNIRLMLYTMNEDLNIVSGDNLSEPIWRSDYYILPYQEIVDTAWFREYKDSSRDNIWLQIDTDKELGNISHIRRLVSYGDYKTVIGYVRITASLEDLFGGFAAFPLEEGISVQLVDDASGSLLYIRGQAEPSGGYLLLREPIPGSDLAIETRVPDAYLERDAGRLRQVIMLLCGAGFAGMAIIGYFVARLSGRKMSRIVALVRSFQEGNLQKRIRFSGNDEFVQIAEAFNIMAKHIQQLINSVYVQGIQRKQAELEALQSQINPHFLYNTLSTIGSLAGLGETAKVTAMVQGLSRFYRLTLNQGDVFIPLAKELEQAATYVDIQRVKYADGFTVHYDVEEDVLDVPVIKLILQPIVENIFKHAWFGETIAIRITARRTGGDIELKVIDNGIGMRPETLKRLSEGPDSERGYGLRNVDERIKLRYGAAYGVTIASIYGGGTTVRLLLPAEPQSDAGGEPASWPAVG